MSLVVVLVCAAAGLAAIAVTAAFIAVRAARRAAGHSGVHTGFGASNSARNTAGNIAENTTGNSANDSGQKTGQNTPAATIARTDASDHEMTSYGVRAGMAQPQQRTDIIAGRVVVHPSNRDVIDATMGRPLVRASMLAYGVAHALRPHARDRILALMRREYRRRRRARLRAGRRAVRASYRQLDGRATDPTFSGGSDE